MKNTDLRRRPEKRGESGSTGERKKKVGAKFTAFHVRGRRRTENRWDLGTGERKASAGSLIAVWKVNGSSKKAMSP